VFVDIKVMPSQVQHQKSFHMHNFHLCRSVRLVSRSNTKWETYVEGAYTHCTVSYWMWVAGKCVPPQQPQCRAALSHSHCLFGIAHLASVHMEIGRIQQL